MAKKKVEPIIGLGNEDKLVVQKSLPLFALWQSDLTLSEFKILDTYLSRIDSHKPDKRQIVLEKGEIETALGVKKINNQDLKTRLKHLMGNVVEIPDKNTKKGFRLVTIFEEAEAEQDSNGLWQVKLECTQKAMKYFFNIENLGYLRYKLRCITSLTSRYTYIMFIYLEANRFRKSWEVDLGELKHILACDTEETYKEFKRFNDLVLKKVYKEMHEKTECKYTYEPIKKGRSVVAIRFTVETLPKLTFEDVDPNQYTIFDVEEELELERLEQAQAERERRDAICSGFSDDEFKEFTDEQLVLLKDLAWDKVPQELIDKHKYTFPRLADAMPWAIHDYLRRVIKTAQTRNPKNLFLYVKKMLENE